MKLLLCLFLVTSFVQAADRSPNVIFILADDLGYTDVACFGSKYYETPNIDLNVLEKCFKNVWSAHHRQWQIQHPSFRLIFGLENTACLGVF